MSSSPSRIPPFDDRFHAHGPGYDEFRSESGVRAQWRFLQSDLDDPSDTWATAQDERIKRLLQENAVTYQVNGANRPWELDGLPYVIDPAEWTLLERGLVQRARLLNAIVADFYGAQTLLKGALPMALAFANPHYLLPACGYRAAENTFLNLIAFDLGRDTSGQWRVLSNRTEAPAGLGYALENRMIMSRSVPTLFERGNIARLAHFFRDYSESLQTLAGESHAGDGLTVILSPGPERTNEFEHAFLGRYLGFPIVEGADLSVREGRVYLKTLEGLKLVNLVIRQIDSVDADPLELNVHSMLGSPGLLGAAVSSHVLVANAIGSGVVENDAIMGFLPALSNLLLGEDLQLPSLASWWCGQDDALAHVLEHLDELVIRSAFNRKPLLDSQVSTYLSTDFAQLSRDQLIRQIRETPYAFVGRENISLSEVPYWRPGNGWRSAPMTLRLFLAATPDGYRLMPGGLVRVAAEGGDISKDVWLPREIGDEVTLLPAASSRTRRSDRDLASRTADDLFWLGRYLERTEGAVRLYRSLFRHISGEGEITDQPVALTILTRLLASMDYLSPHRARRAAGAGRGAVEQELWTILFDPESDDGLARVLANVNRTAEHVRERLSRDAWRLFEGLTSVPKLRWRVHSIADAVALLDGLVEKLSGVNGQIHENMTRGHGWRMLDSGRRLERCLYLVRVIRELCTREPQALGALVLVLDVCDSTITHRARYQSNPSLITVLDLLLIDNSNPRAIIHQIETLQAHFSAMPRPPTEQTLTEIERLLLANQSDLALSDMEKLATVISKSGVRTHLNRLLNRVEKNLHALQGEITRTYFDPALARRY